MTDLLKAAFLDRLERLRELEAALEEQERLLLWDAPRFLTTFKKKVSKARGQIERLVPILVDDPLNRFLAALQTAGATVDIDDVCVYLRICQTLSESDKPLNIQELKPFVPRHAHRTRRKIGARHLLILADANFIAAEREESGSYVPYQLTELGRETIQAILAKA